MLRSHSIENHLSCKQHRNATHCLICLAKREFCKKGARQGSQQFWRNIKHCADIGKLKQFVHPWPCSSTKQAINSATKINEFFVNSIAKLASNKQTIHTLPFLSLVLTGAPKFHFTTTITIADVSYAIQDFTHTSSQQVHPNFI